MEEALEQSMYETRDDLQRLQALLDRSVEQAGAFLRESFQMPDHSLSAGQLVYFWQAMQTVAFATVTSKGEPRVAPIAALLLRGHFYIPTVAAAARSKHLAHHAAISFSYYQQNDIALILHGEATLIREHHPDFVAIESFHREQSGHSVREWGEGVFLQVIPNALYTYARFPNHHAEEAKVERE